MIEFQGVSKVFPSGQVAVEGLDLVIPEGQICMLVGPSGCGKTTTMRMINRLIEPSAGRVLVEGEDVATVDPVQLRRRIGYVIQSVGLFPHRTIRENVATVPELVGEDRRRTSSRVDELLDTVGLSPREYGDRYPAQLSGGQRQRVGVARALAADPRVLLMDEPFSAIDPVVRTRLQDEFSALQSRLCKTIVFVTHDIAEAVRLGHRIVVMSTRGRIEQNADPATVLGAPATDFVADFVGSDRLLARLAVTPLDIATLEPPPPAREVDGTGAGVPSTATLRDALSALLDEPSGRVTVRAPDGRTAGVLTPEGLHRALRASMDSAAPSGGAWS